MNFFRLISSHALRTRASAHQTDGGGASQSHEVVDDAVLVARCQAGDAGAYEQLVTIHRNRVYAMILNMVKNDADAWDLSQEVFVKAWRALPRFKAEAKFSTWLFRITHNAVYDFLRRRKGKDTDEIDDNLLNFETLESSAPTAPKATARPDQALVHNELRAKIEAAMSKLSDNHREVVLLREVQGLDYKEIAEALDCSLGTVMSRLYYARKKLQEELKDEYEAR